MSQQRSSIPEEIRDFVAYDPTTGGFTVLRATRYSRHPVGSSPCNRTANGYDSITFRSKKYTAHRVAWFLVTGDQPDCDVDHINLHRSDNRWANLRLASRAQNMWNSRARTPFGKGVHWHKGRKKFVAQIRIAGKQTHLGVYSTAEQAQAAYRAAAIEAHGTFVRLE